MSFIRPTTANGESLSALDWSGDGPTRRMIAWTLGGGGGGTPSLAIYPVTVMYQSKPFLKADTTSGNQRACVNERYWSGFFWGNSFNDGSDWQSHPALPSQSNNIFQWASSDQAKAYWGVHPFPDAGNQADADQHQEISVFQNDFFNDDNTGTPAVIRYGNWSTHCAIMSNPSGTQYNHVYYYDLLNSQTKLITKNQDFGNIWLDEGNPPQPVLTFGQSAWVTYPGNEEYCGPCRHLIVWQSAAIGLSDLAAIAALDTNAPVLSYCSGHSLPTPWYLNMNPTTTDITDKSGSGHHPAWIGAGRPTNVSYP